MNNEEKEEYRKRKNKVKGSNGDWGSKEKTEERGKENKIEVVEDKNKEREQKEGRKRW